MSSRAELDAIREWCPAEDRIVARTFRCGCMTGHTDSGMMAEAEYCEQGLGLALALRIQRDLVRLTEFSDPRYESRFARLEEIERELHEHRDASGIADRVRRPHDPSKLIGETPRRADPAIASSKGAPEVACGDR